MGEASDPLEVEYATGPSDLRIVRQGPPSGAASFAATFVAPAGWAFDPPSAAGTARLASQLVPSGAGSRDRRTLARFLDRHGATLSAHADPESAEISVWGPDDTWEALLGVLADCVLRPRFEPEDLVRVRRQLLERQLRELRQPGNRADREMLRAVFPAGHPYRTTGTGDRASVGRITDASVRRFHREHFAGPGAVLVATGAVPLDVLRRAAGRLFEPLGPHGPTPVRVPKVPRPRCREWRFDLPGRAQVDVRLAGASIPRSDPAFPGAYLANEVLGGSSMMSRLYRRVRGKGGLAYHASSHLEAMRWGGYWSAQAGAGADRWRRVVPMLREEVVRLHDRPVPAAELERVRESRIGEIQLSLESTSEAHELAVDVAYHDLPADHWKRWPAILRELRPRDVQRAAEVALDPDGGVVVLAGPLGGG